MSACIHGRHPRQLIFPALCNLSKHAFVGFTRSMSQADVEEGVRLSVFHLACSKARYKSLLVATQCNPLLTTVKVEEPGW